MSPVAFKSIWEENEGKYHECGQTYVLTDLLFIKLLLAERVNGHQTLKVSAKISLLESGDWREAGDCSLGGRMRKDDLI